MADAGCPGSVRKCPGVALADLGDTEGFDKDGEENQLYGFQLSDRVYKRIKVRQEGIGSLKFEELGDVDIAYAVPKRHHMLAFAGGKWFSFATLSNKWDGLLTLESSLHTCDRKSAEFGR